MLSFKESYIRITDSRLGIYIRADPREVENNLNISHYRLYQDS